MTTSTLRHLETRLALGELPQHRPYRPTFATTFTLAAVARYLDAPTTGVRMQSDVPGWLQPADAAKLYEIAFYSEGDVLELGTAYGLSASIIASALKAASRSARLITVDLDGSKVEGARATLERLGLGNLVDCRQGDATALCEMLASQESRFGFVFVDHSHAYEDVLAACRLMDRLVLNRGFVLFHDYNDARNNDPDVPTYGVYQAVADGLPSSFAFYGVFGCSALFRRESTQRDSER